MKLLLILLSLTLVSPNSPDFNGISTKEGVVDFSYEDLDGNQINLSDYKGKFVYIDLWATWCGPCLAQHPFLEKMVSSYAEKDIVFISISLDYTGAKDVWKNKVTGKDMGIQLFEGQNGQSDFIKALKVAYIPRFIIVNPKGEIIVDDAPAPSNPKLKRIFKKLGVL